MNADFFEGIPMGFLMLEEHLIEGLPSGIHNKYALQI